MPISNQQASQHAAAYTKAWCVYDAEDYARQVNGV